MGINKFLTQRMIPGCLYAVDPPTAAKPRKLATGCVKLIMMDGQVKVFHRPVIASELLTEHPNHRICHSDSFTIGQKIPALQEGELLKPGNSYFLLPLHFFQSVLSFVTLASSFSSFQSPSTSALVMQRAFEVHKTPSGKLQIRVSDEFIEKIRETQKGVDEAGVVGRGRVCTTAALEKDYRQLVVDCRERQWKPKLETIKEAERKRDVRRQRKKDRQEHKKEEKKQKSMKKRQEKKMKKMKKEVSADGKHLNPPHAPPPHDRKVKKEDTRKTKEKKI